MRRFSRPWLRSIVQRVRRRSLADWKEVAVALAATGAAWTAVRLVPMRRILRATNVPPGCPQRLSATRQARILWAVAAVNRRLFPDRPCLTQAVAARYLLARGGVDTHLHIGVTRSDDGALSAHAWLERDGRVLIGGEQSRSIYHVLRD